MLKKKKHSSLNSCLFQALRASQITKVDLLQKAGTERGWKAPCCQTCRILLQAYLLPLTFQDHQCFTFTDVISDLQKNNPSFPLSFFDAQHRFLPLSSKHTRPLPFIWQWKWALEMAINVYPHHSDDVNMDHKNKSQGSNPSNIVLTFIGVGGREVGFGRCNDRYTKS